MSAAANGDGNGDAVPPAPPMSEKSLDWVLEFAASHGITELVTDLLPRLSAAKVQPIASVCPAVWYDLFPCDDRSVIRRHCQFSFTRFEVS